jgi:hypothetical protein
MFIIGRSGAFCKLVLTPVRKGVMLQSKWDGGQQIYPLFRYFLFGLAMGEAFD